MNAPKAARKRGAIVSPRGQEKIQIARNAAEEQDNYGERYTYEQIRDRTGLSLATTIKIVQGKIPVDRHSLDRFFHGFGLTLERGDYLHPEAVESQENILPTTAPSAIATTPIDWGEAPDVPIFYGQTEELAQLDRWLQVDGCKLVAVLGMGGIGKTSLVTKLAQSVAAEFDLIIWRSLRNAPPLDRLLAEIVPFLSHQQETTANINTFLQQLRASRCLVILDNLETILAAQEMGQFQPDYQQYRELLDRVATSAHQSCIVLTSRERPGVLIPLEGMDEGVKILRLKGSIAATEGIVRAKGLTGTALECANLGDRYGNNPLAMKIVSTSICDLFDGDVGAFLREDTLTFNGLKLLLDRQFGRLSPLEQSIMYWLAINRDCTMIAELHQDLVPMTAKGRLLESIEALSGRSLIEQNRSHFTQQPVVMEYVTEELIDRLITEICTDSPQVLFSHAILKAQAKDYIRESQIGTIVLPLLARLQSRLGDRATLINLFIQILRKLQTEELPGDRLGGYLVGNTINLLSQLKADFTGLNLSGLTIRQAYLRDTFLDRVNLTHSTLIQSVFAEAITDMFGMAYNPDGTLLATIGMSGMLCIYQISTGQWLHSLQAHRGWTPGIAFSDDGLMLFTGGFDRQIHQWDIATGMCCRSWETSSPIWQISLSADGNLLASALENHTIEIWDVNTNTCIQTLAEHGGMVTSVAFHPQAPLLASSSADGSFKLWDCQTWTSTTYRAHTNVVWDVQFNPQGTALVSISADGAAKLWNLATKECLHTWEIGSIVGHLVTFSPDGQILACGCADTIIRCWDVHSGRVVRVFPAYDRSLWNIQFSPDGQTLVGSAEDSQIKFWEVKTGRCLQTLQGELLSFWTIDFNVCGTLLASGGTDARVRLWDLMSGECLKVLKGHTRRINKIRFHRQQPILASCSMDGSVSIWDWDGSCLHTLKHPHWLSAMAFHPTRSMLVSGGFDATIRCWDTDTGELDRSISLPTGAGYIFALAFHPQGEILASGSEDGSLRLWDLESRELVQEVPAHQGRLWDLAFHPQGQILASGGHDGVVKVWDIPSGNCLMTLAGFSSGVMSVTFSSDGTLLAASGDRLIQVWDVTTGACLHTLTGHTNVVSAIAFHLDSSANPPHTLVSASYDETIRYWHLETGECFKVLDPDRLYEGMNITGAIGLTNGQKANLIALGAIEY